MIKTFSILVLGLFYISNPVFSQSNEKNILGLERTFKPFIEGQLGIGLPQELDMDSTFKTIGSIQGNIGYSELIEHKSNILKLDERFLFGRYSSSTADLNLGLNLESDEGIIDSEIFQFGLAYRTGFGYELGPFSLQPYSQYSFIVSYLKFSETEELTENDKAILDRFAGDYRWGTSHGGGVKFSLFKTLTGNVGYDLTSIQPRWTVLPWFGSFAIQTIALGAVSVFGEDIVDSSSLLGPILYFTLKNGLGILFYEATKEQMYWPFESEKPLTTASINAGFSISF